MSEVARGCVLDQGLSSSWPMNQRPGAENGRWAKTAGLENAREVFCLPRRMSASGGSCCFGKVGPGKEPQPLAYPQPSSVDEFEKSFQHNVTSFWSCRYHNPSFLQPTHQKVTNTAHRSEGRCTVLARYAISSFEAHQRNGSVTAQVRQPANKLLRRIDTLTHPHCLISSSS